MIEKMGGRRNKHKLKERREREKHERIKDCEGLTAIECDAEAEEVATVGGALEAGDLADVDGAAVVAEGDLLAEDGAGLHAQLGAGDFDVCTAGAGARANAGTEVGEFAGGDFAGSGGGSGGAETADLGFDHKVLGATEGSQDAVFVAAGTAAWAANGASSEATTEAEAATSASTEAGAIAITTVPGLIHAPAVGNRILCGDSTRVVTPAGGTTDCLKFSTITSDRVGDHFCKRNKQEFLPQPVEKPEAWSDRARTGIFGKRGQESPDRRDDTKNGAVDRPVE